MICSSKQKKTIKLNEEPKEIIIRRERTWRRIFTSWRCMYVTITSLDSETELYFPVFKDIGSAGLAIKENSAKLPQNDSSDERKESLQNNLSFQVRHRQFSGDFGTFAASGRKLMTSEMCFGFRAKKQNGGIYVVDYGILDDKVEGILKEAPHFVAAPIVLLQQTEEELKPIAIQLNQKPGEDNPVFTPQDKPEAWLLAKIWVRNSDFYYHELVSHLLRAHLMAEIFFIASYSMADQHPLSRILRATGRYTIPINITARNTLINEGGFFMKYTAIGEKHLDVLMKATEKITYESLCLPDIVMHHGIENLENFHYRDDGMAIWDAIYEFVHGVVNGCYKDDQDIQKDPELQKMVKFIYKYGFQQNSGPSSLKTRDETIKYITMIMFTCSAQHAAVNHGQYDIYAWMPNGPATMRQPTPKDKEVTEKDIMDTLPDITTTLATMKLICLLSHVPNDFVPLGEYPEEVAYESHMRDPLMEFKSTLKGIGEKIRKRSACQEFPYEYLHPEGMENSVTI
ncbi:polyunsaturated fatty acid 5-lipoxygenase-like isoform X2 [Conger conger]|uniref:polyunsaturated fatty acid 5-lipoxygenase-like isoform X2 n=1 Tax=Conger conger TaxID=82655 RepID=UPI002A5AB97D|nr:polyunsaturated fatty acid 5-lipoxygenase-like isoform X2 [Conger conger]